MRTKAIILKAGQKTVNGTIYTEDALRSAIEKFNNEESLFSASKIATKFRLDGFTITCDGTGKVVSVQKNDKYS